MLTPHQLSPSPRPSPRLTRRLVSALAAGAALLGAACTRGARPAVPPPTEAPTPVPLPAPTPAVPSEGTVDVARAGKLYYHVVGQGRDTVVVPLGAYLEGPLAALGTTHTVIFYDPRQRGRSEPSPDSTTSTFAGDVDDVDAVRAHFGLSRFALVGFSYLGAVAVQYAADHPDRVTRLALLSPIEPTDSLARLNDPKAAMARIDTVKARRLVRLRAAGKDTADVAGYCRAYWEVNAPVYVGDTLKASRVTTDVCAMPNEGIRAFGAHVARVMASLAGRRDFTAAAARVRAPTLVVVGDHDLVATPLGARAWAEHIPDARLLSVVGAGHLVFVDEPERVAHLLDRFLAGDWPDGATVVRR